MPAPAATVRDGIRGVAGSDIATNRLTPDPVPILLTGPVQTPALALPGQPELILQSTGRYFGKISDVA
jgi:hypothetical protein